MKIIPEPDFCSQGQNLIYFIRWIWVIGSHPMIATLSRPVRDSDHRPPRGTGLAARAFWRPFPVVIPSADWNHGAHSRLGFWRGQPGPSLPLLARLSWWRRVVAASGLRFEFAGYLDGFLADIEKRATAFLHQGARALVEALGQFANGLRFLKQFVGLSVGKTGHDAVDLGHGAVEAREGSVGLAYDAVDRITLARQTRGIGLEIQQRVFQHRLIANEDAVDIVQGIADRFRLAQVGGQDRNAVLIQRHRGRGRRAAGQRDRRHTGEPLEFQSHHRVLADRGAVVQPDKGDNLAGVVELERQDFANLNTIKVHAAALAQTAGGTFENDAKRRSLLDAMDFLVPEKADERRGYHRKRRGSDHQVARPRLHPKIRLRCAWSRGPAHFAIT